MIVKLSLAQTLPALMTRRRPGQAEEAKPCTANAASEGRCGEKSCIGVVERREAQPPPSMGARAPEAVDPGNRTQPWACGGLRQCPPKGGLAPPPWRLPALHSPLGETEKGTPAPPRRSRTGAIALAHTLDAPPAAKIAFPHYRHGLLQGL